MKQELSGKITRDMTIGDVLKNYPEKAMKLSEIMTAAGLHCVGCGASTFETIEQGVMVHGFTDEQLIKLVDDLNAVLDEKETEMETKNGVLLKLTNSAVVKVKNIMNNESKNESGLRVAVLSGGCAGHSYDLSIQDEPKEGDYIFEQDGVKIFVDKASLPMLENVEINYIDTLQESGFKFENPNTTGGCGCGKSFN
ncbi:MAG: iron-sulfur cluster assembly accessory protein [Nanoarchaeota archaeon]|nr:iron-sulfur cluster assembly accessory protein [Nanoarchaeota archaeon]